MSRWGNADVTWPKIVYGAIVQHRAKVPGNDAGKMSSLATLRPCDGSHMLRPLPAWLTGYSDNGHIAKMNDFHLRLWGVRVSSGALKLFFWDVDMDVLYPFLLHFP